MTAMGAFGCALPPPICSRSLPFQMAHSHGERGEIIQNNETAQLQLLSSVRPRTATRDWSP